MGGLLTISGSGARLPPWLTAGLWSPCSYTGHTLAKMLVTVLTGIITGFFAVALSKSVGHITEWKLGVMTSAYEKEAPARGFVSFLLFWLIGSLLTSAATALVSLRL